MRKKETSIMFKKLVLILPLITLLPEISQTLDIIYLKINLAIYMIGDIKGQVKW